LQFASFSFDASVSEIFMALVNGASLHLARYETLISEHSLARLLREQDITTVTLPPTMLQELVNHNFPNLRTVISAGEPCTQEIARKWVAGRRFVNAYGPAEATIGPTYHVITGPRAGVSSIPIGRPIANTEIYLLDPRGQPVPIGVPGELYIGGIGVARGYLKRPALTAEKFTPNPFSSETGTRLYRTGDLARYLPDGAIEFLGRIDHQVKVRGFRIELGEIDSLLKRHPDVQDAITMAREDQPGNPRLVTYVLPANEHAPTADELRTFVQKELPEYMTPAVFTPLATFPLTPSGKVDRRMLPAPTSERPALATTYVTPRNQLERSIAELWREVLGMDRVGIQDNFFDLGGHSLLLARVHSKLEELLDRELSMVELFRFPTIRALSEHLGDEDGQEPSLKRTYDRAEKQILARTRRRRPARPRTKNRST